VHINKVPQYLIDIVTIVAESTAQPGLQFADTAAYANPHTRTGFGKRGFCYAGLVAWNCLPSHLHSINDTIVFTCNLKSEHFRQVFDK